MSIKVLRGRGRISHWLFAAEARRLIQKAIEYPTQNVWDNEAGTTRQVPTKQSERLKELESDNAFDLITDMITKANDSMMSYITGRSGSHDWQLNRTVNNLLGDSDTLNLVLDAKLGSVFIGSNSANPHTDKHITLYQYTGDGDNPRMPYKKSLKSKILMRKEWAVKYLDWRSKNLVAISDYEAHVTGLKSKQKKHAIMRQLKHAEDKVKMNTDRVDNCNATLEADIIKYNGEQDWLAAMPKHLLSDKPHILGLMQDPVAMLKNWMRAKTGAEESLHRLRVELSLLGVRE